jgi:hypothetical protein
MRSGAFDALAAVQGRVEHIQQRMNATIPPAVEVARQTGWLEQISIVNRRLLAAEEWLTEQAHIVVGHHDAIREILALLRRDNE